MKTEIACQAKFLGHREVGHATAFLVPIRAIKPLNPHPISVPAYSRIGDDFEIGATYDVIIRRSSPGPAIDWEVIALADR